MNGEFENIDSLFSSEMKDFSPTPPAGAWEAIESRLAVKKQRKPIFTFYRVAASIALILAASTLGYILLTERPDISSQISLEQTDVIESNENEIQNSVINEPSPVKETSTSNQIIPEEKTQSLVVTKSKTTSISAETIAAYNDVQGSQPAEEENLVIANNAAPTTDNEEAIILSLIPTEADLLSEDKYTTPGIIVQQKSTDNEAYLNLLAEFENPEENKKNFDRWAIGGQAGPQYSYRELEAQYASQELIDKYNQEESGIIAYAGGVNVAFKPAKRLSIQSGVYYSKMGQSSPAQYNSNKAVFIGDYTGLPGETRVENNMSINAPPAELRVTTSMGNVSKDIASSTPNEVSYNEGLASLQDQYQEVRQVNQYLEFLEIPLIARYAVIDRKFNLNVLGGLSTNFLISSPVHLDNGSYYTETNNLNSVNYSSTIGMGLGYNFTSRLLFSFEPQFKYYLNAINRNTTTTTVKPYAFGVYTGISYSF